MIPITFLYTNSLALTIAQLTSECNKLMTSITSVTQTVKMLDEVLGGIGTRLHVLTKNYLPDRVLKSKHTANDVESVANSPSVRVISPEASTSNDVLSAINSTGDAAKSIEELLKQFEGAPEVMKKFTGALGILGCLGSGIQGLTDLCTKEHTTLAEKITIGGNLAQAATTVLMAGLEFGPPGAVVAAIADIALSAFAIDDENKRMAETYETEKQEQYKRAKGTFVMDEDSADAYISNIAEVQTVKPKPPHRWKMKTNPTDEVIQRYGAHAFDLTIPIPVQAVDQLNPRLNMPQTIKYDDVADQLPRKPSYFEETFGRRSSLTGMGMSRGNQAFVQSSVAARKKAKQYDLIHHTYTLARTELAIKESAYDLLNRSNGQRIANNGMPMAGRVEPATPGSGRRVVINLNRAMIEHFVINTADVKEGLGRLKEQVEEALLQILNSEVQ